MIMAHDMQHMISYSCFSNHRSISLRYENIDDENFLRSKPSGCHRTTLISGFDFQHGISCPKRIVSP